MEYIGGQALVEGVMIISPKKIACSVRKPDGKIKSKIENRNPRYTKYSKVWFIRGIFALIEMLYLGTKALTWSSNEQLKREEKITKKELTFTLLISIIIGVLIFVLLPLFLSKILIQSRGILFNITDGIFRIIVFIVYLILISRSKEIQRIFQYHGAEHMAVHCYEHKKKLTVDNVKKFITLHPRCGTAFLIIVLIISIFVFSFIWSKNLFIKFFFRILLIPVIAAVSYEILKLSARFQNKLFFKMLIQPGLWFQKITTKKPDDKQIEVAIASVKSVLN